LQEIARKHNIMIDLGNIRFSDNEARGKLTMRSFGGRVLTGNPVAATNTDLERIAAKHSLPDNLLGRKIRYGSQILTITGVKASRTKYPFTVEGVRGGKYKMSVEQIREGLI
jgi:hypothetical protein